MTQLTLLIDQEAMPALEDRIYQFDFSRKSELIAGQTILASPAPVFSQSNNVGAAALTVGAPVISGSQVQFDITGPSTIDGTQYSVACRVKLSGGGYLIVRGKLLAQK